MKAILVTCPHCGARVHVAGLSDEVRCEYCGTSSRVQRRTQFFQTMLPPPPAAPHRPRQIAVQRRSSAATIIVLVAVLVPIALTIGIAAFIFSAIRHAKSFATTTTTSSPGDPQSLALARRGGDADGFEWLGTDGALFADVDGDGALDVIGRARKHGGDEFRAVALEGKTGKKLWQSDRLGSVNDASQSKLVLAGDLVVFASMRGEVLALKVGSGEKLWSTKLDERITAICDGSPSTLIAVGADDVERPLRRSDGTTPSADNNTLGDSFADAMAKKPTPGTPPKRRGAVACNRYPSDDEIRVRRITAIRNASSDHDLGRRHGLTVHPGEAIAAGPGGRVLHGQRERGTRIPMLVGLDDKDHARWKIPVPTDPLGVLAHRPIAVSVGDKEVCVSYHDDSVAKPPHLACFALADGARRWDEVAGDRLRTLHVEGGNLYLFAWGSVIARETSSGKTRWTYP